ncbi:MAG: YncE family protein [Ktedonobacteraceae bacterium]|nr:YncE family protein [Ktedonobacteraceae bacterium]
MIQNISRIYRWLVAPALACAMLLFAAVPAAYADGGAPNLAYVAGTAKSISIIDVGQQKETGRIAIPGDPHMIQLSNDGRFLYVTQPQLNKVAIIAAKTGETICSADVPGHPTLLSNIVTNTNTIFAAGSGANSVTALDTSDCTIKRTFQTSGPVHGIFVAVIGSALTNTIGNQLWVAAGNAVEVFDDSNGQKLASITIAGTPEYIIIPPGATAYVTTQQGSIFAIGLNKHETLQLVSGGKYSLMDYDAITGEIYVPDQQNKQIIVLTPVNPGYEPPREPNRVIKVDAVPVSIAITSDGQLGFAALQGGGVAMLDIPGRQTINTFNVGGSPHFIITGLYPPAIGTTPQQASTFGTIANIAAYVLVAAILIVPVLLLVRSSKRRPRPASIEKPE